MNSRLFSRRLFALILFLGCSLTAAQLQAFTFQTSPEKLTAGEGFLLQIEGRSAGDCRVRFEGKRYTPFPVSRGVWEIFLPLGIKTAGERELILEKVSPDGPVEEYSFPLEVTPREIRTIRLGKASREMRSNQPSIPEQQKKVLKAIRNVEPEKYWDQPFAIPVQGKISTEFGLRRDLGTYSYYHWGVDFSAPEGTPVKAANSGKVILSESDFNVYGNLLIINHGQGVVSCYFHLSKILKEAGDTVSRNEVIGEVGSTGWSSGPHLHFAVYLQGSAVDPFWLVSFTSE
ncbi:MAG: M23 family metallopeptidase [Candidatus Omnitrophota bacterium]